MKYFFTVTAAVDCERGYNQSTAVKYGH